MYKTLVILSLLLFPIFGSTQTYKKGFEEINKLKEGALIVRLQTKEKALAKMADKVRPEYLESKRADIYSLNKEIIDSVRFYFDFCPVFFVDAYQSKNIKQGMLDEVVFLNDKVEIDETIQFNHSTFLTAEFSSLKMNNGDADPSLSNSGSRSFVFKDSKFIQLNKPFPFFVRTWALFPKQRTKGTVVKKMNSKLITFHNLANGISSKD